MIRFFTKLFRYLNESKRKFQERKICFIFTIILNRKKEKVFTLTYFSQIPFYNNEHKINQIIFYPNIELFLVVPTLAYQRNITLDLYLLDVVLTWLNSCKYVVYVVWFLALDIISIEHSKYINLIVDLDEKLSLVNSCKLFWMFRKWTSDFIF